jgi:ComF family protein
MSEVSKANGLDCDVILPVPLHPERLRWRGFNQSLLLARRIGEALQVGVDAFSLVRARNTQPQVELSATERKRNVREAFRLTRRSQILGRRVLLVDDVYTSGATVSECAMVLKEGGAKEIRVLTLARVM